MNNKEEYVEGYLGLGGALKLDSLSSNRCFF